MKNKLIWMLLALLGFSAGCEEETEEYGCPYATYSVKGKVTDEAENPIPGIRVTLDRYHDQLTDSDGRFAFVNLQATLSSDARLCAEDVDGPENGSYRSAEVPVNFVRNPAVPSGGWYEGDYTADDVTVTMQEESAAE